MKTKLTLMGSLATLGAVASLNAQSAVTAAVGYHTESVIPGFNLVGVNVGNAVAAAGAFDGPGAVDADVVFTDLLEAGMPYTVQNVTTGDVAAVVSFDATTLTTDPALTTAADDAYEVRQDQTIGTLFGAGNEAGLLGGTQDDADVIWIPLAGGGFIQIYRSAGQGGGFPAITDGWRFVDGLDGDLDADAASVVAPFYNSMFLQVRGPALDLVFVGHVRGDDEEGGGHGAKRTNVSVIPGFNPVNRIVPVSVTVAEMSLADQLTAGTQDTGDVAWLPDGGGGYVQVFNSVGQGGGFPPIDDGARYVDGLDGDLNADASGEVVPSGLLVQRRAAAGLVSVEVPSELDL